MGFINFFLDHGFALAAVVFFTVVVPGFPWPSIPIEFISALQTVFQYLNSFNHVLPIDTILWLFGLGISLEAAMWLFYLVKFLIRFISNVDTRDN